VFAESANISKPSPEKGTVPDGFEKPAGGGAIRRSHVPLRSALEPAILFEFSQVGRLAAESFRFSVERPSSLVVLK